MEEYLDEILKFIGGQITSDTDLAEYFPDPEYVDGKYTPSIDIKKPLKLGVIRLMLWFTNNIVEDKNYPFAVISTGSDTTVFYYSTERYENMEPLCVNYSEEDETSISLYNYTYIRIPSRYKPNISLNLKSYASSEEFLDAMLTTEPFNRFKFAD